MSTERCEDCGCLDAWCQCARPDPLPLPPVEPAPTPTAGTTSERVRRLIADTRRTVTEKGSRWA